MSSRARRIDRRAQTEQRAKSEQVNEFWAENLQRQVGDVVSGQDIVRFAKAGEDRQTDSCGCRTRRCRAFARDTVHQNANTCIRQQLCGEREIGKLLVAIGVGRPVQICRGKIAPLKTASRRPHEAGQLARRFGAIAKRHQKAAEL